MKQCVSCLKVGGCSWGVGKEYSGGVVGGEAWILHFMFQNEAHSSSVSTQTINNLPAGAQLLKGQDS